MIQMDEMDDMIKMLAGALEEQRESMLTQRLKMIAGQPPHNVIFRWQILLST